MPSGPVNIDEADGRDEAQQAVDTLADHHGHNTQQAEDGSREGDGGGEVDWVSQEQAQLEGNPKPEHAPRCCVPTGQF